MNKQQLVYLLALSAMFLIDGRLASAQQTGITDQTSAHQSTKSGTQFLRLVKDSNGVPAALETAITRYRSDDGKLLVDLIGVIHIGESKYYRQLNRQFEQYDALLYELVAAEENQVPDLNARSSGSNPLHWLQSTMQNMLGLQSQLKYINYKKPNFVHADLSPRQMQQKMAARGDTAWSVAMQAMSEVMKQQSRASTGNAGGAAALGEDISSIEDLFSLIQNPQKLKTMLATQFASAGTLDAGLGSTLNELLITDRNQAAMKVLAQEIDKGQTQIGIFYGAAHMPDFEKRLVADFGMKKTKQVWAKAWDLKSAPKQSSPTAGLTDMFFQLMDSLEE